MDSPVDSPIKDSSFSSTQRTLWNAAAWPRQQSELQKLADGQFPHDVEYIVRLVFKLHHFTGNLSHEFENSCPRSITNNFDNRLKLCGTTPTRFFGDIIPWLASKALLLVPTFRQARRIMTSEEATEALLAERSSIVASENEEKETNVPSLPILSSQDEGVLILSKHDILILLAAGFFGIVPGNVKTSTPKQYPTLPAFFLPLFLCDAHKMQCLLVYFIALYAMERDPCRGPEALHAERITFYRRVVDITGGQAGPSRSLFWEDSSKPLLPFGVHEEGKIEDAAPEHVLADFANAYLGGGVLTGGNAQEEILFCVFPEALAGMLVCEKMEKNESVVMCGVERFAQHTGYGDQFAFAGPPPVPALKESGGYHQHVELDAYGRRQNQIVALDAYPNPNFRQFSKPLVLRELLKAYVAFLGDFAPIEGKRRPVATGNWGCGNFGGSLQLKCLIQWLAASQAERPIVYYTFHEKDLSNLRQVVFAMEQKYKTVGGLSMILKNTCERWSGDWRRFSSLASLSSPSRNWGGSISIPSWETEILSDDEETATISTRVPKLFASLLEE